MKDITVTAVAWEPNDSENLIVAERCGKMKMINWKTRDVLKE